MYQRIAGLDILTLLDHKFGYSAWEFPRYAYLCGFYLSLQYLGRRMQQEKPYQ